MLQVKVCDACRCHKNKRWMYFGTASTTSLLTPQWWNKPGVFVRWYVNFYDLMLRCWEHLAVTTAGRCVTRIHINLQKCPNLCSMHWQHTVSSCSKEARNANTVGYENTAWILLWLIQAKFNTTKTLDMNPALVGVKEIISFKRVTLLVPMTFWGAGQQMLETVTI